MTKRKIPIYSMTLYVLASFLLFFSLWGAYKSYQYISEMIAMNQFEITGNEYELINFFMTNHAHYVFFAIILCTLGWMLHSSTSKAVISDSTRQVNSSISNTKDPITEEDFEEWFHKQG